MTGRAESRTVLTAFLDKRRAAPESAAVQYYGRTISRDELDGLSDRLALCLADVGVGRGDMIAVSLQNTPHFAVAVLATWKLGAVFVPVSPMLRSGELASLLSDCDASALVAHPDMAAVIRDALADLRRPPKVLWSNPSDLAGAMAGPWGAGPAPAPDFGSLLETEIEFQSNGHRTLGSLGLPLAPDPDELAVLAYTSGTTGPSKGAMLTHANIGYQAFVTHDSLGLTADDKVLTVAPFFHITGFGLHLALGLGRGLPLVMTYRFDQRHIQELIEHYAPSFTVGTITAFIALADAATDDERAEKALRSMSSVVSGGAAVPAGVVDRYERQFGVYIRNGYGLTETASACVIVPRGERAPVEPASGAVSIGKPLPGVRVRILADDGTEAPRGSAGEIVVEGPQVGAGYWNRPEESAATFHPDGLRTGDVGIIDDQGWIYVVDRKKDLIVVSGYKVWPRDVEDVLFRHPAVAEAAVVGVPDSYRGESVKAYIQLRPNATATVEELDRHCREHLSAYKCPRQYEMVDALPKSASGKTLRRLLRTGVPG